MSVAQFSVRLPIAAFDAASRQYVAIPQWWSDSAVGGPDMAQVRIEGQIEAIGEAFKALGRELEIFGPNGGRVWWGRVHGVDVNFGGTTVSLSLDNVYNAVAVAYVQTNPDGSIERKTTPWAEDARSITRYGRREILLSITEGGQTAAERYRDRFLEATSAPVPETRIGGGQVGATVFGRGYWYDLARRYYTDPRGIVEYTQSGAGVQGTGNYYQVTTISFVAPNRILDSANGLGHLSPGDRVLVSGAANAENNRWFTVDSIINAGEIHIVGAVIAGAAGPSVTLSTSSGAAGTLAQAFQLPAGVGSWAARRVAVQVRRVGNPGDNFIIELRADSAGAPVWPPLASATVTGSTLGTGFSWIEAPLASPVTLLTGTTYWLTVRRSQAVNNAAHLAGHYAVNFNETPDFGYPFLSFLAAWQPRDPDANMPFRVTGRVATTTQMQSIVTASSLTGTDLEVNSSVETLQYRSGDRLMLDEMTDLLEIGTDQGQRLLASVSRLQQVRIRVKPEPRSGMGLILAADGGIRTAGRQQLEPGQLVAGRYMELEFLPMLDAVRPNDTIFIERSRYDAESGVLSVESEGTASAWTMGVLPG